MHPQDISQYEAEIDQLSLEIDAKNAKIESLERALESEELRNAKLYDWLRQVKLSLPLGDNGEWEDHDCWTSCVGIREIVDGAV